MRELSLTDQEEWFESLQNKTHKLHVYNSGFKTNKPIGASGLLYINWVIRSADFSFYIGDKEKYIGDDGIAFEAAQLLIDYGFKNLNLHKIWM